MSKGLRNTMASVALATMGLFGGIKTAQAEEYTPAEKTKIIEMAKVLEFNSNNNPYIEHAKELFDAQKKLPKELKEFMEKNTNLVDFAKHPKFSLKISDKGKFVCFDDESSMFFEIGKDGKMTETTHDSGTAMYEYEGSMVRVNINTHTFSMSWFDNLANTTSSPELSYAPQNGQIKTLAPSVTKKLSEKVK